MNNHFRLIGAGALLALAIPLGLRAQNEPLMAVDISLIAVTSGDGSVLGANVTVGGSGYTSPPTVTFSGGGGSGAAGTAVLTNGTVSGITITQGGVNYTSSPTITLSAPGSPAAATATLSAPGPLTGVTLTSGGAGYLAAPSVTFSGGGGTGATATTTIQNGTVTSITLTAPGTGYTAAPTIVISSPGEQATAVVRGLGTLYLNPKQNESFGPVGQYITIGAIARGTFPLSGYTYKFFVNGAPLGSSTNPQPPGGGAGYVSWEPPQPGAYVLTVEASDGAHTATSVPIRYFATGTAIIAPADNALVPNGSSVVVQATATPPPSGSSAFVQKMEFFVDGALAATDTTYPYSFIYTPAPSATPHVVEARGYDNNGSPILPLGGASAKRTFSMVSAIGTPPLVRILNPTNESSVSAGSQLTIIADAVAPNGFIKNVEFYVNGVLLSATQRFPFTTTWTPQVPGSYQFVAIGYDDKSNAVSSAPVAVTATGSFPTATIVDPERNGLTVIQGTTLPVKVRAFGPDGGISSLRTIEFLVDGIVSDSLPKATTSGSGTSGTTTAPVLTEPFVFNWKSNVAVGTHRLAARVTGTNGLSITSAEVSVNVVANQLPEVAITGPSAAGSGTANVATTLSASADDVDGSVELVEFYVNGTRVGTSSTTPYQVTWTPSAAGTYNLTAKATDNSGASVVSEVVQFVVDPATPSGPAQSNINATVYRGDYGSTGESGRFALAVNRNNRGTLIAYSTAPAGKSYLWTDVAINPDGSFSVRDSGNQVTLSGQTSATGVAGNFSGKTFIGPITPSGGAVSPLLVTGTLTGVPNSQVVAIVGGDGSVTLYSASGTAREVGGDMLSATGNYSFAAPTGGRLSGTVANTASIVSGSISGSVAGNFLLRQQPSRITNISTRALAGSGDRTMVAGFVVSGTGQKPLLLRAVGPTLAAFGVANPLIDPTLNLQSRSVPSIAFNNDWGTTPAVATVAAQVGAFALTPGSRDAAISASVTPGMYSAVVGGSSVAGAALIEIYDTDTAPTVTSRITNISTRAQVAAGDALIAGFVISGDVRKKVLIRAVGPTLASFGLTSVLSDPKIEVLAGTTVIATNNDWTETSSFTSVSTTSPTVGAFPLAANSKDAALVLQLTPGAYTVQITGAANTTGTVLVEIYDADL